MRRVHSTWHFTGVCLGILIGVTLAQWWRVPVVLALLAGLICIVLAFWRQRRFLVVLAFCGGACIGLVRGSVGQAALGEYAPLIGTKAIVRGVVTDDVDVTPKGTTRMKLDNLLVNGTPYAGQVWVTTRGGDKVRRSDIVTVGGVMQEGFGNFAASLIGGTVEHVTRPTPGDVALDIRDGFAGNVRATVSEPGASLGVGFLLGQKSALPTDLIEALQIAGLTHIVVASGYNLTILVRLGRRAFAKISKYLATATSAGLVIAFIAMTGMSPSMTRAGMVAGLSLWAWYFGRKFHPVTLLALVAALTVLWNPSYAWGDVGWLLSFGAFAGVMIIGPLMIAYFYGKEKPPLPVQILFETVAATIATVPIIIATFGTFSNVALLANMLILPFIPITMLFTAIAGVGGMLHMPIFGWVADQLLGVMVGIVKWCASLPWAQSEVSWQWWGMALYFTVVAAACAYMKWRTKYNLYTANIID